MLHDDICLLKQQEKHLLAIVKNYEYLNESQGTVSL